MGAMRSRTSLTATAWRSVEMPGRRQRARPASVAPSFVGQTMPGSASQTRRRSTSPRASQRRVTWRARGSPTGAPPSCASSRATCGTLAARCSASQTTAARSRSVTRAPVPPSLLGQPLLLSLPLYVLSFLLPLPFSLLPSSLSLTSSSPSNRSSSFLTHTTRASLWAGGVGQDLSAHAGAVNRTVGGRRHYARGSVTPFAPGGPKNRPAVIASEGLQGLAWCQAPGNRPRKMRLPVPGGVRRRAYLARPRWLPRPSRRRRRRARHTHRA